MKKILLVVLAFSLVQAVAAERYKDRMFDVNVEKDVVYASNVNHLATLTTLSKAITMLAAKNGSRAVYLYDNEFDTQSIDLHMDVYSPKGDKETGRPAVLVMHGGAFAAGSKDDMEQQSVTYCDSLAARGFVAVAVEYRLGITATAEDGLITIDSANFSRAVYRGIQDVRAAVRYMRAKAKDFGIDPNRIYLLGNSAGAILALENIYIDKNSEIPEVAFADPSLGGLDLYGVDGYSPEANAAVALWGGIHDVGIIEDKSTPVLLVHGTGDSTVLFKTGRPLGNIATTLENIMPAAAASIGSLAFDIKTPTLYGSYVIDSVLTAKGIEHETYFVDDMPHEFYDEDDYDVKVKEKVFGFLYGLTQKEAKASIRAVALAKASRIHMGEDNMNFTLGSGNDVQFAVLDLRGRKVMQGLAVAGETVDLSGLNTGVYVLNVRGERPVRFGLAK